MKISKKLTKEIISYMLGNLGVVAPPLWGMRGVTEKAFNTGKILKVQVDNNIKTIPIYSAQCNIDKSKLKVVALMIEDLFPTFITLMMLDDGPVYALSQSTEDDVGIFLASYDKKTWINVSIYDKLLACAGLEKITDQGLGWQSQNEIDIFLPLLQQIIEM